MEHGALRNSHSLTKKFFTEKRNDPGAVLHPVGSYVWLRSHKLGYQPAKVVEAIHSDTEGGCVVIEQNGGVVLKNVPEKEKARITPMQEKYLEPDPVIDLNSLDLSTAAILHSLRYRFEHDSDYLQIGGRTILYVNRFEDDEYKLEKTEKMIEKMMEGIELLREPSVETLAEECFEGLNLTSGKHAQSCVLTGTSESGRRSLAQTFTRKIVQLSHPNDVVWWEKLQAADQILSIFGGEQFIRWTEMHLKYKKVNGIKQEGKLVGAALACFLFDTSSLTQISKSFECFYQLCEAAQTSHKELREKFKIKPSECYVYLSEDGTAAPAPESLSAQNSKFCISEGCNLESYGVSSRCVIHQRLNGGICTHSGCKELDYGNGYCTDHENREEIYDRERSWLDTLNALKILSVKDKELDSIVSMLSDILELGNMDLHELAESKDNVDNDSDIFGVSLKGLIEILTTKTIKVGSETYYKTMSKQNVSRQRDALVRALYSGLFNWLIRVINRGVSYTKDGKETVLRSLQADSTENKKSRIGLVSTLETVGLMKSSASNSLEHLINNYAQERIYTYYSINVMESMARNWAEDGVAVIFPEGNEMCLPLILDTKSSNINKQKAPIMNVASKKVPVRNKRASIWRMKSNRNGAVPGKDNVFRTGNTLPKQKTKKGILNILEEELRVPGGTDKKLINKIEQLHKTNKKLLLSPKKDSFKIQHYGCSVVYSIHGFIKKTKSSVLSDVIREQIIEATSKELVRSFLTKHSDSEQQKSFSRITQQNMKRVHNATKVKSPNSKLGRFLSSGSFGSSSELEEDEDVEVTRRVKGSQFGGTMERMKRRARKNRKARFSVARPNISFGLRKPALDFPDLSIHTEGSVDLEDNRIVSPKSFRDNTFATGSNNDSKPKEKKKENEKQKDLENSLVVENSMATIISMLDTTSPHFVFCMSSNKSRKFDEGFDSLYVLSQLKHFGIQQTFNDRLNKSSFGAGLLPKQFLITYRPLTLLLKKHDRQDVLALCNRLADYNLFPPSAYATGKSGKIYIKSAYMGDLDTALTFAYNDLAAKMQSVIRRFVQRCKFLRQMNDHIENVLEKVVTGGRKDDVLAAIDMAKRWNMAYGKMNIALGKLSRIEADEELRKELSAAAESENSIALHDALNKAKTTGLQICEELQHAVDVFSTIQAKHNEMAKQGEAERRRNMAGVLLEMKEEQEFEKNFNVEEFIEELRLLKEEQEQKQELIEEQKAQEAASTVDEDVDNVPENEELDESSEKVGDDNVHSEANEYDSDEHISEINTPTTLKEANVRNTADLHHERDSLYSSKTYESNRTYDTKYDFGSSYTLDGDDDEEDEDEEENDDDWKKIDENLPYIKKYLKTKESADRESMESISTDNSIIKLPVKTNNSNGGFLKRVASRNAQKLVGGIRRLRSRRT